MRQSAGTTADTKAGMGGRICTACAVLAHPARVRIVRLLAERNSCVCGEIVDHLPLAQSTVSQHLKVLRKAGIIDGEVDGPRVCYWINHAVIGRFRDLLLRL